MNQGALTEIAQQLANLKLALETLRQENEEIKQENQSIKNKLSQMPVNPIVAQFEDESLQPIPIEFSSPNDINLDVLKALPTFNGDINEYGTWRDLTSQLMEGMEQHRNSSRYRDALVIFKTKIQGPAAKVLANFKTKFNYKAIMNRLDYTYSDQRPLYVLKDELSRIVQGRKTISEFHDEISQALANIITKNHHDGRL
ncbi:Retrovirus-related Gag polyprotein from transposon gypsy [Eumeta japonica]|uniref:Retrovirus-related Gag polyprotein from transposon gypsy n=1 Tax=Eumeta variegata TaxID=151549 RepID=A0A4C1SK86_EUMVA|nr:Retrovirus-related Gag polyprotein from transposon gypsy [Eumeta japonica]